MTHTFVCPNCGASFAFEPPVIHFLDTGSLPNKAPAKCPNGHVNMYAFDDSSSNES
jgi:hypothetical protein